MRGRPAVTLAAALGALLLIAAVAEGLARWLAPARPFAQGMPFLTEDPVLLWRLTPGFTGELGGGVALRVSAEGLRDEPRAPLPPGGRRVLSLGESSTWGFGVAAEDCYTERLGRMLSTPERPVDAVNAGQPAWSIWQSARWAETALPAWDPDLVIAWHERNDFLPRGPGNPRDPFAWSLTDRQLCEARAPLARLLGPLSRLRLRSLLFDALAPHLMPEAGASDVPRVPEADRREAWARLARACRRQGAALLILKPCYGDARHAADPFLAEQAVLHGTAFADVSDLGGEGMFQPDDTHPTAEGHARIAARLAPVLARLLVERP